MNHYKTDFTLEDLDRFVKKLQEQHPDPYGVVFLVSQQFESIRDNPRFDEAMQSAAKKYLKSRGYE